MPARFPERLEPALLPHLPRYLRALAIRAERAALNPAKEQERARLIEPYAAAWKLLQSKPPTTDEGIRLAGDFRWALEEYRVSVFAQELGTSRPVSPKRLDDLLEQVRRAG